MERYSTNEKYFDERFNENFKKLEEYLTKKFENKLNSILDARMKYH